MAVKMFAEWLFIAWTPGGDVCLANRAFEELVGEDPNGLIGRPVMSIAEQYWTDPAVAEPTLDLLRAPAVETVRVRGELHTAAQPQVPVKVWARALDIEGRRWCVATATTEKEALEAPDGGPGIVRALERVVLVIVDDRWSVHAIGGDLAAAFGEPMEEILGTSLLDWVTPATAAALDMVSDAPCTIELAHRSERVVPALILGAWQQPPDTRVCAIYPLEPGAVVEEEVALGPFRRPTDADRERIARLAPITDRQWDILRLLMAGMTPAEIGEELYVSASTVRNHLSAMFRKFGVSTQHELLRLLSSLS